MCSHNNKPYNTSFIQKQKKRFIMLMIVVVFRDIGLDVLFIVNLPMLWNSKSKFNKWKITLIFNKYRRWSISVWFQPINSKCQWIYMHQNQPSPNSRPVLNTIQHFKFDLTPNLLMKLGYYSVLIYCIDTLLIHI